MHTPQLCTSDELSPMPLALCLSMMAGVGSVTEPWPPAGGLVLFSPPLSCVGAVVGVVAVVASETVLDAALCRLSLSGLVARRGLLLVCFAAAGGPGLDRGGGTPPASPRAAARSDKCLPQ